MNPEDIIHHIQDDRVSEQSNGTAKGKNPATHHFTPYITPYASQKAIPKFEIPPDGAHSDSVLAMIKDELDLDGKPNLNLAR